MSYTVTNIACRDDTGLDDANQGVLVITNTGASAITVTDITTVDSVDVFRNCLNDLFFLPQTVFPGEDALFTLVGNAEYSEEPWPSWGGQQFTITTSEEAPTTHTWILFSEIDYINWTSANSSTFECSTGPSSTTTTPSPTTTTPSPTSPPTAPPTTTTCNPCYPFVPTTPSVPPPVVLPTTRTIAPIVMITTTPPPSSPLTISIVTTSTTVAPSTTSTTSTTTISPTTVPPSLIQPCKSGCNTLNF